MGTPGQRPRGNPKNELSERLTRTASKVRYALVAALWPYNFSNLIALHLSSLIFLEIRPTEMTAVICCSRFPSTKRLLAARTRRRLTIGTTSYTQIRHHRSPRRVIPVHRQRPLETSHRLEEWKWHRQWPYRHHLLLTMKPSRWRTRSTSFLVLQRRRSKTLRPGQR